MPVTDPLYPYERIKLVRDVVSAKIMAGLGVPTVEYRLARAKLDGREVLGIESPFVPMSSLKHAPELADKIVNSDDFVRGSVIDAWLGNVDRIQNRGNLWVQESPEGPRVIFGDYDQGLRLGLEIFGVPKVPTGVFGRHAAKSPEALRRAVADILALSDAEISTFVDSAIADMSGFGAESAPYLKAVLIENRDSLRRRDPFIGLASSAFDRRCGSMPVVAGALADGVLQGGVRPTPRSALVDAALKELISLWDKPAQVEPARALFERIVRARLADATWPSTRSRAVPRCKVPTNFIYMRVEPAAAMAAERGTTDDPAPRAVPLVCARPGAAGRCTATAARAAPTPRTPWPGSGRRCASARTSSSSTWRSPRTTCWWSATTPSSSPRSAWAPTAGAPPPCPSGP